MLVELFHKVTQVIRRFSCCLRNRQCGGIKGSQAEGNQLDIGLAQCGTF